MTSRIAPETPPFAPEIEAALTRIMPPGTDPLRLFTTLARNPRVFQRFMAGGLLDKGSITLREREIAILRTTARCGCVYEWGVHVAFFAEKAGLRDEQLVASASGAADDPAWMPREALIIALADALHDDNRIGDDLWARLGAEFADAQLIEFVVLAGFYHTVSFAANAFALAPEKAAARFPG